MPYVLNNQVVLSRPPDGPLTAQLGAFAASRTALGSARSSICREIRLAAGFSHWLRQEGIALRRIDADQVARYLRQRRRKIQPGPGDDAALRHLLEFLRRVGVIAAERTAARRLTSAERGVHAYVEYLRNVRALASATITNYAPFILRFLTGLFGEGPVRLARVTARDVVHFVGRHAPRLHLQRAKLLTSALRSFLRYARYRGAVTRD
jgi:integrase/recombinase XerD